MLWERSPESRTAPCRRASHRPRSSDRASEKLNRGDSRLNPAISLLPGDAIGAMAGKPDPHSLPPDLRTKSCMPHLPSLVLKLGAATLKSAQQGRDSISFIAPKKASHSRASNSRFHLLSPRRNSRRRRRGSPVDFLRLEGLLRVAVALHGDKLAHPAPTRGIAFAVENVINGLACL